MPEHSHPDQPINQSDPQMHEDHAHNHDKHGKHMHHGHGHEHGRIETDLYSHRVGLRAVQISTAGMLLVALIQILIALGGGSAGLFADALHNLSDVLTTVALWIAFLVSQRAANRQYTYGYYRAEDLAGIFIVLVIVASAGASAVESILKLMSGTLPSQLYLSMGAAAIGCLGNEVLAQYKIRVGRRINSVPLIADGQHSRIDGLTSLAALLGLLGVQLGWPLADPLAGILITLVILSMVYGTSRNVLRRLLDAVDPQVVPAIIEAAHAIEGVETITNVKARWLGRALHISMNIEVNAALTLAQAHDIAEHVRHKLFHNIAGVADVIVHIDPSGDAHQETAHHSQAVPRPLVEH